MQERVNALSGHYVICGFGRVSRQVVQDLRAKGKACVVVDPEPVALAGIAGLISPMQFETNLVKFDIPALFILTVLILVFFLRKRGLQHFEAITILVFYSVYIILKLWFA